MRLPVSLALFVLVLCGCGDAPPTIDGYTYKTVKIGDQEWFAENLKTTVYANGDDIPYSRTDKSWETQKMGMRASYDHDEEMNAKYGQLYNWYAVKDERGLCPNGWHVPSDEEWQDLEVLLGMSRADVSIWGNRGSGELDIGYKLKAKSGWSGAKWKFASPTTPPGDNGTDEFGFSALPGGFRDGKYWFAGHFEGYWWSSSPVREAAVYRRFYNRNPSILRQTMDQTIGMSVRCLRDSE